MRSPSADTAPSPLFAAASPAAPVRVVSQSRGGVMLSQVAAVARLLRLPQWRRSEDREMLRVSQQQRETLLVSRGGVESESMWIEATAPVQASVSGPPSPDGRGTRSGGREPLPKPALSTPSEALFRARTASAPEPENDEPAPATPGLPDAGPGT